MTREGKRRTKRHAMCGGFTLIEMLVVIVIFFILMGIGLISYESMRADNALNATASELASTFREARALAMRHNKPYQIAFNNTKESFVGTHGTWDGVTHGTPWQDGHKRFHEVLAVGSDTATRNYPDYNKSFLSDNENGTDHWYAIYKPFYYGEAQTNIPTRWRRPTWKHIYEGASAADTTFMEEKYDPARLQVGPRRFLQKGVRFWQVYPYNLSDAGFDDDEAFVPGGGDLTDLVPRIIDLSPWGLPSGGAVRPYDSAEITYGVDGCLPFRHNNQDRSKGGYFHWQNYPVHSAILNGASSIRTLNHLEIGGNDGARVTSGLAALPSGGFSTERSEPMASTADAGTAWEGVRRLPQHIATSEYRPYGDPMSSTGTAFANSLYLGVVWMEDRTKHRFVRVQPTTGQVTVERQFAPFTDR